MIFNVLKIELSWQESLIKESVIKYCLKEKNLHVSFKLLSSFYCWGQSYDRFV